MGLKKRSEVVAECSIPAYCVKTLGSRHILIGGGGGSAKTGVRNELQLFLLSYGSVFNKIVDGSRFAVNSLGGQLMAQLNCSLDTAEFANMNMDAIVLNAEPEKGRYLVAVGQDQFCTLYETLGFCINDETGGLALDFRSLLRVETDKRAAGDDSYQKCVRLFRTQNQEIKMLTAGTDGYLRLWSIADLLEMRRRGRDDEGEPTQIPDQIEAAAELEIHTGKSLVEEIDVSACGQVLATILPQTTILWDLGDQGVKILELPQEGGPDEVISKKFKIRSLRFTGLDKTRKCAVFVTAHNQRTRSSKEVAHLGLWSFAKANWNCRLLRTRKACNETISCLEISECGQLTAIGTMGGSVAIFDTQTLQSLLMLRETHSSFVTALAFFPQKTYDIKDLGRIGDKPPGRCFLPGICANSRAALVSISVDKRIMVHQLPFPSRSTFSGSLLILSILAALFHFLLWAIFIR